MKITNIKTLLATSIVTAIIVVGVSAYTIIKEGETQKRYVTDSITAAQNKNSEGTENVENRQICVSETTCLILDGVSIYFVYGDNKRFDVTTAFLDSPYVDDLTEENPVSLFLGGSSAIIEPLAITYDKRLFLKLHTGYSGIYTRKFDSGPWFPLFDPKSDQGLFILDPQTSELELVAPHSAELPYLHIDSIGPNNDAVTYAYYRIADGHEAVTSIYLYNFRTKTTDRLGAIHGFNWTDDGYKYQQRIEVECPDDNHPYNSLGCRETSDEVLEVSLIN
jgi:hypothetical protein